MNNNRRRLMLSLNGSEEAQLTSLVLLHMDRNANDVYGHTVTLGGMGTNGFPAAMGRWYGVGGNYTDTAMHSSATASVNIEEIGLSNEFTIEFWINAYYREKTVRPIITLDTGGIYTWLVLIYNGYVSFYDVSQEQVGSYYIDAYRSWHHIAVSYKAEKYLDANDPGNYTGDDLYEATVSYFVDGQPVLKTTSSHYWSDYTWTVDYYDTLYINKSQTSSGTSGEYYIDEVRISNGLYPDSGFPVPTAPYEA